MQAVRAARLIERLLDGDDSQVVLTGDLDAMPDSASIRFWCGKQSLDAMSVHYQDAWDVTHAAEPGHTFTPDNPLVSEQWRPRPGRRIDYILIRTGDKGASLSTPANSPSISTIDDVWASDHFGVVADLKNRLAS